MGLKLKENINPEILRKYGFLTGKEWAEKGERCLVGIGHEYEYSWYHKFLMNPDELEKISYMDDDNDIPTISITIRTDKDHNNDLYISCAISDSYHIEGYELDFVSETIFDLVKDDILEKY